MIARLIHWSIGNRFLVLLATLFSSAAFAASDLVVKVEGINKAEGRVRVALYSQAKGFKKEKKAVTVQEAFATTEPVTVTIRDKQVPVRLVKPPFVKGGQSAV